MQVKALKSRIITADDDIFESVLRALKTARLSLKNKDILIVTSKVLSIAERGIVQVSDQKSYDNLVRKEADQVIGKSQVTLTLKNGIYIPWAGIDRSNVQPGYAVIWPKDPFKAAQTICLQLKKRYKLKDLGVIISDSHCVPLRRGVSGIAIGYAGFKGVNDLRGKKDIYGNILKVTQQNIADMIASAAHLVMGEADEQTPFALVRGAPTIFTGAKINPQESVIPAEECLFSPLYKHTRSRRRSVPTNKSLRSKHHIIAYRSHKK
jgi:dihydrofolate synthase / folylpolyglutamate synthase